MNRTLYEYLKEKHLTEAKADVEYEKSYSSIDRAIFDQICLMDPKTQVQNDAIINIGFGAKQLLLPKYMGGETNFIANADAIKSALEAYYPGIKNYPKFPQFNSVADFMTFMENPVEMNPEDVELQRENKIDKIYNDYYSDIQREVFDKIISLDPETNESKIGSIAKNLLLRCYKKGDRDFVNNSDALIAAIERYVAYKNTYPADKQDLMSYESINDFVSYIPTSRTIASLAGTDYAPVEGVDFIHVATSPNYDVFKPLTFRGSERIAHAQNAQNCWCTAGGSDGRSYGATRDHSRDSTYWHQYTDAAGEDLYMFMHKSEPQNRKKNYNMSYKHGSVYEFRDGDNQATYGGREIVDGIHKDWEAFLLANPEVAVALKTSSDSNLANDIVVRQLSAAAEYSKKPLIIDGISDLYAMIKHKKIYKATVKELIIGNVPQVPPGFAHGFTALNKITFNPGIREIGIQAFKSCPNLTTISQELPEGLTLIDEEAFMNCVQLKGAIHIPDSLEQVKLRAFDGTKCKLKIDRARTKPIKFAAADREWVNAHVMSIKK